MPKANELLALAEAIYNQCDRDTAFSAHMQAGSLFVSVSVHTGHDGENNTFDWLRGGGPGEMTLDELHDAMVDYIVANRKQERAA